MYFQNILYFSAAFLMLFSGRHIVAAIAQNNFRFNSVGVYNFFISIMLVVIGICMR